jgi:hypothetical protein
MPSFEPDVPAVAFLKSVSPGHALLVVQNITVGNMEDDPWSSGPVLLTMVATNPSLPGALYSSTDAFYQWSEGCGSAQLQIDCAPSYPC